MASPRIDTCYRRASDIHHLDVVSPTRHWKSMSTDREFTALGRMRRGLRAKQCADQKTFEGTMRQRDSEARLQQDDEVKTWVIIFAHR